MGTPRFILPGLAGFFVSSLVLRVSGNGVGEALFGAVVFGVAIATLGFAPPVALAAERMWGGVLVWAVILGGLVLIGVIFVLPFVLSRGICDEEERAVFSEFPQYGNLVKDPKPFSESGGCAVVYNTPDSPQQVSAYYAERLTDHGWTVGHRLAKGVDAEAQFEGTLVRAKRNGFTYEVGYESLEFYDPPRPGTHAAVHLWKN